MLPAGADSIISPYVSARRRVADKIFKLTKADALFIGNDDEDTPKKRALEAGGDAVAVESPDAAGIFNAVRAEMETR